MCGGGGEGEAEGEIDDENVGYTLPHLTTSRITSYSSAQVFVLES